MNALFLILATLAAHAAPDATGLLKHSDRARGAASALGGISWMADLDSTENETRTKMTYFIKVRGDDALAEATAPPRQKGEIVLFNDRTLWFYKPGLKKPVSISPRQKLMGQAANGDIASTHYARDYDATSIGEEKDAWRLELKAKAKNVTYDRIRYWISKDTQVAVKAEFLTLWGEIFKTALFKYGNQVMIKGEKYPFVSAMEIHDAKNPANVTTIFYSDPKEKPYPASLFNVNNLIK